MTARMDLAGLKVHLLFCAYAPSFGRCMGIVFTASGIPDIAAVPQGV